MVKKQNGKSGKRGFYGPVLDETTCLRLEEAAGMEGLDQEIALLRLKLCELIKKSPQECELQLKVISTIASLVKIRYCISKEQKKSLREAVQKVLTELAIPLGVKTLIR